MIMYVYSHNYGRQRHFGAGSNLKKYHLYHAHGNENEMNKATPVPLSSEMRNIMKSRRSYLDAYYKREINNKMNDIEQLMGNMMLKKTTQKKILDYVILDYE
ncbi:hypothetical protein TNCV_904051 [Trichonephila clavipes]|nr:hypothetical protein TNCV_904051 [Trichonephila clavipes]